MHHMSTSHEDLSRRLALWSASVSLDAPLDEKARVLLIDALALGLASRKSTVASALQALAPVAASMRGPGATDWLTGRQADAGTATFRNAVLAHDRFQDDCEMISWTHPGSFVVPAALAAAESRDTTVSDLLAGVVSGYALCAWLGAEETVPKALMGRGFRCSPILAPMASAVAFSRAAGLGVDATTHAIGTAALLGRGALQAVGGGGDDWRFQNGSAARDGVGAAMWGDAGLLSGQGALEGPNGFLSAYTGLKELPTRWGYEPDLCDVLGVWHKRYPTLGDNMASAVVAAIAHTRLQGQAPLRVELTMPTDFFHFPGTQNVPPFTTRMAAAASVRFVAACCLTDGSFDLAHLERREDPHLLDLTGDVDVRPDDSLTLTQARISVRTASGTVEVGPESIPAEQFFRDGPAAVVAATELLGPLGRTVAEEILEAPADEPVGSALAELRKALAA